MPSKLEQQMADQIARRAVPAASGVDLGGTVLGTMTREAGGADILRLAQLVRSRFQSRGNLDKVYIENLAESIREEGLLDPIIVRPLPPAATEQGGHSMSTLPLYEIVAGHHRVEAFALLGRAEIPGFVRHLTDVEAARALTSENTIRKDLGDWELYKHMTMLHAVGAVDSQRTAARVLNISRAAVQALEAFALLPQSACDLLDDHPKLVGYNLAAKLQPYLPAHELVVFDALVLLAKGKLSQASVPAWIEEKANPRTIKPRKDIELGGGVRLVMNADGARLSGRIDYDRLHRLIEANLADLLVADKAA